MNVCLKKILANPKICDILAFIKLTNAYVYIVSKRGLLRILYTTDS